MGIGYVISGILAGISLGMSVTTISHKLLFGDEIRKYESAMQQCESELTNEDSCVIIAVPSNKAGEQS